MAVIGPKSEFQLYFGIAALLFVGYFGCFYTETLDDAYITARYALRLLEGYPYGTWNRGAVNLVEGSTTTIWPFLMALGGSKNALIDVSKILSGATFLLTLFLFWKAPTDGPLSRHLISKRSPFLALVACGVYGPFAWYAASGMETIFFASFVALVVFLPFTKLGTGALHLAVCMILCITRPDGILIAVSVSALYAYLEKNRIWVFVCVLIFVAIVFATRYLYFGYFLPNTLYAKSGGNFLYLYTGLEYVKKYILSHIFFLTFLGFGFIRWRKLNVLHYSIALGLAVYCGLIVKTGGDSPFAFPFWRHFIQLSPLIAFLVFESIAAFGRGARVLNGAATAIFFIIPLLPITNSWGSVDRFYSELFDSVPSRYTKWTSFIKRIADKRTLIASPLAGELPFRVDAIHLDTLGLNNTYIAHFGKFDPGGPTDSKTDMAYVLEKRPDILDVYFSGPTYANGAYTKLVGGWRIKMIRNTLCNPIFREYVFVANGPYKTADSAIFLHESFVKNSTKLAGLDLRPVRDNTKFLQFLDGYCRNAAKSE